MNSAVFFSAHLYSILFLVTPKRTLFKDLVTYVVNYFSFLFYHQFRLEICSVKLGTNVYPITALGEVLQDRISILWVNSIQDKIMHIPKHTSPRLPMVAMERRKKLSKFLNTGGPRIARKFVQKFLRAIRNHAIWIYTRVRAKNRAIARNRTNFTLTSNILGPKN